MKGFGTELQKENINSRLYRKVNSDNLMNSGELCTSTPQSISLLPSGDMCLVFPKEEREGLYTSFDADAGKDFGYDEFRVELDIQDIQYIVYPNSWDIIIDEIDESDERFDDPERDPSIWIENLEDLGIATVISEADYKKLENDNINFNF